MGGWFSQKRLNVKNREYLRVTFLNRIICYFRGLHGHQSRGGLNPTGYQWQAGASWFLRCAFFFAPFTGGKEKEHDTALKQCVEQRNGGRTQIGKSSFCWARPFNRNPVTTGGARASLLGGGFDDLTEICGNLSVTVGLNEKQFLIHLIKKLTINIVRRDTISLNFDKFFLSIFCSAEET